MNKAKYFLYLTISSLILLEILLRVFGFSPHIHNSKEDSKITSTSPLFKQDEYLGYVYKEGSKKVTLNGKLTYNLNINEDGTRLNPYFIESENKIAIFGCSFFAGMGVSDSATIGAQLQLLTKDYSVNNYSIPGHGMTSQYLKIKELILNDKKPSIAVFEIASFHLIRNVGGYDFIKNFSTIKETPIHYVKAEMNKKKDISFHILNVLDEYSIIAKYSSFYNFIYSEIKNYKYSDDYQATLYNQLIMMTYNLCEKNNIMPVFFIITNDLESNRIKNHMEKNSITFIESKVNYNDDKYNLNPYDQHPNNVAHKSYALELFQYLNLKGKL